MFQPLRLPKTAVLEVRREMPDTLRHAPHHSIAMNDLAVRARLPESGDLALAGRVLSIRPKADSVSSLPTTALLPRAAAQRGSVTQLPAPRRFPVASLDLSRRDVGLPYGVPRHINAATLKAIAGGRTSDRLLHKTAAGWEFVSDEALIDLSDGSQEYRLGRLTIFS